MITVLSVLRSGGIYTAEWVRKLAAAVARHLHVPHRFVCISDVPVPCERIALEQDWPGYWSKIEMFRPGIITGPTLYIDLDTVIVAAIDPLASLKHRFAMLRNFGRAYYIGSGIMWFGEPPSPSIYDRFAQRPHELIAEYRRNEHHAHIGDQAYLWDAIGDKNIARLTDDVPGLIQLYPKNFPPSGELPEGCAVVCFKGKTKPPDAMHLSWCQEAWA